MVDTAILSAQVESYVQQLLNEVDTVKQSEQFKGWLQFIGKFHKYSFGNCMLILMARPDATHVKGFQQWKALGRYVKKDEKGIPILAPIIIKYEIANEDTSETVERKKLVNFKVVYVFDVSQTDGEALPETPRWRMGEADENGLYQAMLKYANGIDIDVQLGDHISYPDGAAGICDRGARTIITIARDGGNICHTLAHELCHALGNPWIDEQDDVASMLTVSRGDIEVTVEAVATAVCLNYGIDTYKGSSTYMALWGSDRVMGAMEYIQKRTAEIIEGIEGARA